MGDNNEGDGNEGDGNEGDDNGDDNGGDNDDNGVSALHDDYGEALLAECLGVECHAPVVVPVPDSQILPDSVWDGACPSGGEVAAVMEVEKETLADTCVDSQTPESPITPTQLEATPRPEDPPCPPVPVVTTVKDPLPSASQYSTEDIAFLQERIKSIK